MGLSLKQYGRRLIEEKKAQQKKARKEGPEFVGDRRPASGLWVVNKVRQVVAGQIERVHLDGTVTVRNSKGTVRHAVSTINEAGYSLVAERPPWNDHFGCQHLWAVDEPKVVSERAEPTNLCLCGCGEMAKKVFRPGHDAKLKSRIHKSGFSVLTEEQRAYAIDRWSHLDAIRLAIMEEKSKKRSHPKKVVDVKPKKKKARSKKK